MSNIHSKKASMMKAVENHDPEPQCLIFFINNYGVHNFTYFQKHSELFDNMDELKTNGEYYVFEIAKNGRPRKPFLDLEKEYLSKEACMTDYKKILSKIQKDIIKVFNEAYGEKLEIDDILILNSTGEISKGYKISFHIIIQPKDRTLIYMNSKWGNSAAYHFYSLLINEDEMYMKLLDESVYRSDSALRIMGSAKSFDDHRKLIPISGHTYKPIKVSDERRYLLTYTVGTCTELKTPIIEQTSIPKKLVVNGIMPTTKIDEKLLKLVKKHHPTAVFKGFHKGIYFAFNYEDRTEKCPVSGNIHNGTNGFFVIETSRGYYIKCHSANCKGKKNIGEIDYENDFIKDGYQIKKQYLITEEKMEYDKVGRLIITWMENGKQKTLIVKSPMGTGKTTMVKKILDKYPELKKILWITHRQTLTEQIYGQFMNRGFVSYLDEKGCLYQHSKVIIQIDSLDRIKQMRDNGGYNINVYDLIIIDEIEGAMNHYASPYLENTMHTGRSIFELMMMCIKNSKKILLMDADIGIRTQLITQEIGSYLLINNKFRPTKKRFIITNKTDKFHNNIMKDIDNGMNICIVSMSASDIEGIATILEEKNVEYTIHTSHTDDKLKKELRNVNDYWVKFQVVLFSPCIESGVDFSEEHFDKVYGIMKSGKATCSQRAFLQMVGRIRKLKYNQIVCLYHGEYEIKYEKYTFDDVLHQLRYCEMINGKKILSDVSYEQQIHNGVVSVERKSVNISTYDMINIHNEVEQLNKNHLTFLSVLVSLIEKSGHTVRFSHVERSISGKKDSSKEVSKISMKTKILDIDETQYDIKKLLEKQNLNKLNETEKIALKKIFLIKSFGIVNTKNRELLRDFLGKYCGKEETIQRFEDLFSYTEIESDNQLDNTSVAKRKTLRKLIIDIINRFMDNKIKNFNMDTSIDVTMDQEKYDRIISDICKNSLYFRNQQENRQLLFQAKKKYMSVCDNNRRHYIASIQHILRIFGIKLSTGPRLKVNNMRIQTYKLQIDEEIKHIADIKYQKNMRSLFNYDDLDNENPSNQYDKMQHTKNISIITGSIYADLFINKTSE